MPTDQRLSRIMPDPYKVIIAGGRDILDPDRVLPHIERFHAAYPIDVLLCGMCPTGVDRHAWLWADGKGIPIEEYPADWKQYGVSAGPIRNRAMANNADACLVLWDGRSKGSASMLRCAKRVYGVMVVDLIV